MCGELDGNGLADLRFCTQIPERQIGCDDLISRLRHGTVGGIAEKQFCFRLIHDIELNIVSVCVGEESNGHAQPVFSDKIRV